MTVNGVPVPRSEFAYSYYKNNGHGQTDRKTVEEYASLYANYKLKLAAALEARLDTTLAYRQTLASYLNRQGGGAVVAGTDVLAEARHLYDRTKKAIGTQGLIRPSEIFLRLSTQASRSEQNRIAQRADSIWRALQSGVDFATLARKVSQDPQTAAQGGDMGWLQPQQTFVEFEQAAYALQPGQLSRPILAPDGYHIILMKERKQLEPFEMLQDDLVRSFQQQGLRKAVAGQKVSATQQASPVNEQHLSQEYHDGLLVYEITNREVWQRAKTDEVGLRAWFDAHKKTYVSEGPHYRGVAYVTKTKADMKAVKKYLKRLPFEQWEAGLRATFNSNGEERVKMTVGVFKPGDNAMIDREVFKRRDVVVQMDASYPFEAVYGKKLKKYPATMNVLRRLIPVVMMAVPLFGVAANEKDSVAVGSVIDEVIWVVGDEAILRSDVEAMRMQSALEGVKWSGNPDCIIPEQIAVQKLFKHQAAIDSIEVTDADVAQEVEQQINYWLDMVDGSRERLEEYKHQPLSQIRNDLRDELKDRQMVQRMKRKLVEDISVTPAEVRRYFKDMPLDSLPFVPTEVEVQIIQMTPRIEVEELNRVKDELRDYTDRVNKGEASFQTLARLYSEDPGTARRGGELGLVGRGTLDPAFATVAFNLTDPKKVSKIVESEFGYHIIQLIEKRGEKVNVRHILRKPVVSDEAVERALGRLDSIADDIRAGKFTFEEAAPVISDDKDTRNSKGLMSTNMMQTGHTSSRFQMQDLPPEIAKVVDTLQVGQISKSFKMINQRGKTVCVIAKLKNRIEGHKATMTEDFQVLKDMVEKKRQEERIHQWVVDKIKNVYTRLNDDYKDCQFEFEGWVKSN